MPRDADLGRDLAAQLSAEFTGRISEVKFTYDSYVELDRLAEHEPVCIVSTQTVDHMREARGQWRENAHLMLTLISVAGAIDNEQWIDEWLDSWDTLVRSAREKVLLGRHKPTGIEFDYRYDSELFHNHRRLVTQGMLIYGNIQH